MTAVVANTILRLGDLVVTTYLHLFGDEAVTVLLLPVGSGLV
jgi:hypothetical protein